MNIQKVNSKIFLVHGLAEKAVSLCQLQIIYYAKMKTYTCLITVSKYTDLSTELLTEGEPAVFKSI